MYWTKIKKERKSTIESEGWYHSFEYKGYKARMIRNSQGCWCGYVGLEEGHDMYGVEYNDIPVSVHGGLTYGEYGLRMQPEEHLYWIGFDCAHLGDLALYEGAWDYGSDIYRTKEYVISEIHNMIEQLSD